MGSDEAPILAILPPSRAALGVQSSCMSQLWWLQMVPGGDGTRRGFRATSPAQAAHESGGPQTRAFADEATAGAAVGSLR